MAVYDLAIADNVFVKDKLQAYIQEIDILFTTINTELIGDTSYGTNFEQFLHTLKPNEQQVVQYINEKLQQCYFYNSFFTEVNAAQLTGLYREVYYISIEIKSINTQEVLSTKIYQYR